MSNNLDTIVNVLTLAIVTGQFARQATVRLDDITARVRIRRFARQYGNGQ